MRLDENPFVPSNLNALFLAHSLITQTHGRFVGVDGLQATTPTGLTFAFNTPPVGAGSGGVDFTMQQGQGYLVYTDSPTSYTIVKDPEPPPGGTDLSIPPGLIQQLLQQYPLPPLPPLPGH